MGKIVTDQVDPKDTELMAHLFNQVFRPERDGDSFARRLESRMHPLFMVARIDNEAVGFYVGMELKPAIHFSWLCGVMPDARRMGVATVLMRDAMGWAQSRGYSGLRFECTNDKRPMLHFGISQGFNIIGLRWDEERLQNLLIFERNLAEPIDDKPNEQS